MKGRWVRKLAWPVLLLNPHFLFEVGVSGLMISPMPVFMRP